METFLESGNKIHFTSLGCSRNLVDTEAMLSLVLQPKIDGRAAISFGQLYEVEIIVLIDYDLISTLATPIKTSSLLVLNE